MTDTALLLALFTGALYLVGLINWSVYLNAWGVDAQLFPVNVNDYLVNGFFVVLGSFRSINAFLLILCFGGIIGIFLGIHQYLYRFDAIVILILIVCAFLLVFIFFLPHAFEKGRISAQQKMEELELDASEKKYELFKDYLIVGEGVVVRELKGYLIAANERFVAVYTNQEVMVLPIGSLLSIKSRNFKAMGR